MTLFGPCEREISVFDVRFALDFGAGAYMTERWVPLTWECDKSEYPLTMNIFCDEESTQYHNGLFSTETTCRTVTDKNGVIEPIKLCLGSISNIQKWEWDNILFIHTQDTSTTSKSIVITTVKDFFNSQLPKSRRTHDAWLDGDIESGR